MGLGNSKIKVIPNIWHHVRGGRQGCGLFGMESGIRVVAYCRGSRTESLHLSGVLDTSEASLGYKEFYPKRTDRVSVAAGVAGRNLRQPQCLCLSLTLISSRFR